MTRRLGDLTKGPAVAQAGSPDMRAEQCAKERTIWLRLAVADDDPSFDTASAKLEGSLDRPNCAVHLIRLHSQRLG